MYLPSEKDGLKYGTQLIKKDLECLNINNKRKTSPHIDLCSQLDEYTYYTSSFADKIIITLESQLLVATVRLQQRFAEYFEQPKKILNTILNFKYLFFRQG